MKTAASIFSWIGGVVTTIIEILNLVSGFDAIYVNNRGKVVTEHLDSPTWLWVVWIIVLTIRVVILVWRELSVRNGKKKACGIFTIFFASVVGGILTLCIPDTDLGGYSTRKYHYSSHGPSTTTYTPRLYTQEQRDNLVANNRVLLEKGIITQAEFERRVADIDAKTRKPVNQAPQAPSENEKIELLEKYKKLLDEGVITQEEFENKKKELL